MKKYLYLLSIISSLFSCSSNKNNEGKENELIQDSVITSIKDSSFDNSEKNEGLLSMSIDNQIDQVEGDIDGDGINEVFVIYNVEDYDSTEFIQDSPRELVVFAMKEKEYVEIYRSKNAMLNSDGGGMMGDPYRYLKIENGELIIAHSGGSSWKWFEEEKYKWNGSDFEQTFSAGYYGKPCEYWDSTSYNFETGRAYLETLHESCPSEEVLTDSVCSEEFIKTGIRILLKTKGSKDIHFKSPKYKKTFYLSSKD